MMNRDMISSHRNINTIWITNPKNQQNTKIIEKVVFHITAIEQATWKQYLLYFIILE